MAEENTEKRPSPYNYPANSHKKKEADAPKADKKIEKVISGNVVERKKPLGRKIAETFAGDDAKSVGSYILFDVIIPATKNLISDMVGQGIDRLLFGASGGSRGSRGSSSRHTSYNKMYNSSDRRDDGRRELSQRARSTHDFNEIVLETRGEAEDVLDNLTNLIEEYGVAAISDMYDLVGITGSFTDTKWGWSDLRSASIRRIRDGYLLDFPRPTYIE